MLYSIVRTYEPYIPTAGGTMGWFLLMSIFVRVREAHVYGGGGRGGMTQRKQNVPPSIDQYFGELMID